MAYKIQKRNAGETLFADASDWLSCGECIERMRAMSTFAGDVQIVDEQRHIIATTLDKADLSAGNGKAASGQQKPAGRLESTNRRVRHARNE